MISLHKIVINVDIGMLLIWNLQKTCKTKFDIKRKVDIKRRVLAGWKLPSSLKNRVKKISEKQKNKRHQYELECHKNISGNEK